MSRGDKGKQEDPAGLHHGRMCLARRFSEEPFQESAVRWILWFDKLTTNGANNERGKSVRPELVEGRGRARLKFRDRLIPTGGRPVGSPRQ